MIEALIWLGVAVVTAAAVWFAEPYHTRLIEAVHARLDLKSREG